VFVQSWQDSRLSWDPSNYGGVDTLRISASGIWKPDVALLEASV